MSNNSSLFASESFLESFMYGIFVPFSNTTTLATTGPAKGPLPASSTPPIYKYPFAYPSFSNVFINSSLSSSFFILTLPSLKH